MESVAEAHSAHAQLFDLCEYLADRERLCQHMSGGERLQEPLVSQGMSTVCGCFCGGLCSM